MSSDISIIDASHVNETMWNTTMMSAASSGTSLPSGAKRSVLDCVNVADLTRGQKTLFLDGCKIFVHGMQPAHAEKCAKLINSGKKKSHQVTSVDGFVDAVLPCVTDYKSSFFRVSALPYLKAS